MSKILVSLLCARKQNCGWRGETGGWENPEEIGERTGTEEGPH